MCTFEKRGRVYVLTLTGDGEHRLSPYVIADIRSALSLARSDSDASGRGRALVTAADGRFFSNGFDLAWAKAADSPAAIQERVVSMGNHFVHLIADLISLPMPTIAAVTGHAAAAGFMLAISHDYMEMRADRGFLYMSELELGMPIPPYFLALLKSKIPDPKVVRDMVLRSAKITADEAARKGIIDGAHGSAAETVAAAVRRAEDLAARNWNGGVYSSIRRGALPEICRAVGLPEDTEEDRRALLFTAAKL
ncbi:3,2-trans-enoyl-CoA isomerase, mitochondrial [Apostasia shenzhenica]|uniref:Delta(3)-Delta(2)-enoyl-CoA isomerase n=1 Tax=Apostasia shenzhenica TaxID=1088818 RepID=A0A2I0BC39_9ASPA|nr:3,2-trans-enoyl-CoA isomerase, mitochondrial [Apostasia shenzhenica]